jgi:hypothetical protein
MHRLKQRGRYLRTAINIPDPMAYELFDRRSGIIHNHIDFFDLVASKFGFLRNARWIYL